MFHFFLSIPGSSDIIKKFGGMGISVIAIRIEIAASSDEDVGTPRNDKKSVMIDVGWIIGIL